MEHNMDRQQMMHKPTGLYFFPVSALSVNPEVKGEFLHLASSVSYFSLLCLH